ncbi:hypothetical protein L7F22_064316 [Adiantum nelumboides]|nr:hypothetical protein [Adiantum nelumboides]
MGDLAKRGLVGRERNIKYDGYRLTYGGYDWLAIKAMRDNGSLLGVGTRVGVGKESDIYLAESSGPPGDDDGEKGEGVSPQARTVVLKMHRLGRISFRKIKEKRDYLSNRKTSPSWMFLSRLAAKREWDFMQALFQHGFPVPTPLAQSRHSILMSRIDGFPLRQIVDLPHEHVASLYGSLMTLIVRLARAGLIHCDFNEFNIMVREIRRDDDGEENAGIEDDHDDDRSVFQRGLRLRGQEPEAEQDYVLRPGECIERGKGFERIYRAPAIRHDDDRNDGFRSGDDDEDAIDQDKGESEDSWEGEESDSDVEDGANNEGLRVILKDGSLIEPILIDFPQMISVEHPNAEKRFRFHSDRYPRFVDVVESQRGERREKRDKLVSRKVKAGLELTNRDKSDLGLELDVLTKASGLGGNSKGQNVLDTHLTSLNIAQNDDKDMEEGRRGEHEEAELERHESAEFAERLEEVGQEDDFVDERGALIKMRKDKIPSKGAALKMAADGDERGVQLRLLSESQRRQRRDEKHHGKKAQATKVGRQWRGGGGKGKTSDRALINNSVQF